MAADSMKEKLKLLKQLKAEAKQDDATRKLLKAANKKTHDLIKESEKVKKNVKDIE